MVHKAKKQRFSLLVERKNIWFLSAILVTLLVCFFLYREQMNLLSQKPLQPVPTDAMYRNKNATVEQRTDDLVSRMSLDEKIGQMALVEKNSVLRPEDIASYAIGALLSGAGAKPEDNTQSGWLTMVEDFVATSKTSRLGIPVLYGVDAIHGHTNVPGATVFPHAIGLGATGDSALVSAVASATREEMLATGIYWNFSPNLDLPQDIRWGRTYETFSDDATRTAELARASVGGFQGTTEQGKPKRALATLKHYIGVGGMEWGSSSNKNFKIDQGTTPPDEQALRDIYLPAFREGVRAGAGSVMVGLNTWGNTKLAAERYLITDVLKQELAFQGFVVSDWYGVYEIPGGNYKAAVTAINAGVDMVMLPFDYKTFIANVRYAVSHGDIAESRIDDAVRRIIRTKFELGLFDTDAKPSTPLEVIGSTPHRTIARKAVSESLVLLKNEQQTLPISPGVRRIVVAGSAADNVGRQSGAWTVEWQGVDGNWLPGGTSILSGIRNRAGKNIDIMYELRGDFASNTPLADVGIAVVGEQPYAEGWGDNNTLTLSTEDLETIEKVKKASKQTVVIIVSGRPLMISKELPTWDSAVAAWLPGSEGEGVADVLFGDTPFTGTLPLPWPDHIGQLPIAPNGHTTDGTPLLFPRFFGLKK